MCLQTNSKRNTENCSLAQPSLSEIKLNYAVKLNDTETKGFQGNFETFLNKDISHLTSVNQRARGGGMRMYAFNKLANSSCDYHDDLFFKSSL